MSSHAVLIKCSLSSWAGCSYLIAFQVWQIHICCWAKQLGVIKAIKFKWWVGGKVPTQLKATQCSLGVQVLCLNCWTLASTQLCPVAHYWKGCLCLTLTAIRKTAFLSDEEFQIIVDKVNRCLARYSPRATTTNRPTTGHWISLHGLAQIDQKCQFWAKFGRFWAKYNFFY